MRYSVEARGRFGERVMSVYYYLSRAEAERAATEMIRLPGVQSITIEVDRGGK